MESGPGKLVVATGSAPVVITDAVVRKDNTTIRLRANRDFSQFFPKGSKLGR
jgi:hypothetical protein